MDGDVLLVVVNAGNGQWGSGELCREYGRGARELDGDFQLAGSGVWGREYCGELGLNRLRKKAEFLAKSLKSIPQGLKPTLILLALCRG
jgi:hypothetical protein